jgi:RND family efflux transporter MFP subunit
MKPSSENALPKSEREGGRFPFLALVIVILVIGVLLVVGALPRLHQQAVLAQEAQQTRATVPLVTVASPHLVPERGLQLPANIEPILETVINARTQGYLRKLYVDIGSHVKAGQVLAEIEAPDTDLQVTQAEAQQSQAMATVGQSLADLARLRANLQQAQTAVVQQQAVVKESEASLASTKAKLMQARAAEAQSEAALSQAQETLKEKQAALESAEAQLALARATNNRYQQLLQKGFVSQQQADQTAATLKTNEAAVTSAKADIQVAQKGVEAAQHAVDSSKAAVAAAQADVEAAQQSVQAAKATLESLKVAVHGARADLLAGESAVQANKDALTASQANANRYRVLRGFEKVVAPFDGVITSRNVDVGSLITPGTTTATLSANSSPAPTTGMFGIARTDVVRVQVNVPQAYIDAVRPGSLAIIQVRELPGRVFVGKVVSSSDALDTDTRTFLAEVHIPNPQGLLVPGMYAEVTLKPSKPVYRLQIPATALIYDSKGMRVAVLTPDSRVHFQSVQIGHDYGKEVEITGGLSPTDRILLNPPDTLVEGMKVKAMSANTSNLSR